MSPRLVITAVLLGALGCASGGGSGPDASMDMLCAVCDPAAECQLASGRAQCTCPPGYTDPNGDGSSCRDIDECATNNHDCDDRATCTNRTGDYLCTCMEGYTGDGTVCRDIDECAMTELCGANATCMNLDGRYLCACNSGYMGDGQTCVDIDECMVGMDQCHADATCTNDQGSYLCACNDGYSGDGFTCTDVDECMLGVDDCDGLTVCRNEPGSFRCTCADGYHDEYGDGSSCRLGDAGRVYLIGHDYFTHNADSNRLLGNAVFSANTSGTVQILAFNRWAQNGVGREVASVNSAINARAAELGRQFVLTTFSDEFLLSENLLGKHVLLVYEQELVPGPTAMENVGRIWSLTAQTFVRSGGIVIVTDFRGDTWRVLPAAGLMSITSATDVTVDALLTVAEPGHYAGTDVNSSYPAPAGTRSYVTTDGFPLVVTSTDKPVVLVRNVSDRCVTVEDFETGTWPRAGWTAPSGASLGVVQTSAAHDFLYGITSPSWHYQTRILLSNVGDRARGWVKITGRFGEANLGFGSSRQGTYSVMLSAATDQVIIQRNDDYAVAELQKAAFDVQRDVWYLMEVEYGGGGLVTVRLYTDASPAPVFTLGTTINGLRVGGTAMRGYFGADIDSMQVCGAP